MSDDNEPLFELTMGNGPSLNEQYAKIEVQQQALQQEIDQGLHEPEVAKLIAPIKAEMQVDDSFEALSQTEQDAIARYAAEKLVIDGGFSEVTGIWISDDDGEVELYINDTHIINFAPEVAYEKFITRVDEPALAPPMEQETSDAPIPRQEVPTRDQDDLINLQVNQGQVTFDAEGNDLERNRYYSRHLHWPGGVSGVTIGRGYDMGSRTTEQVYDDLTTAGLDEQTAQNMSAGAGLTGQQAEDFVNQHQAEYGSISREVQRNLFEDVTYPNYVNSAQTRYETYVNNMPDAPNWDELDPRIRDIAADLTYQQGSMWNRQLPHVVENDPDALAEYIRNTPELSRYEAGRNRARYLETGEN